MEITVKFKSHAEYRAALDAVYVLRMSTQKELSREVNSVQRDEGQLEILAARHGAVCDALRAMENPE